MQSTKLYLQEHTPASDKIRHLLKRNLVELNGIINTTAMLNFHLFIFKFHGIFTKLSSLKYGLPGKKRISYCDFQRSASTMSCSWQDIFSPGDIGVYFKSLAYKKAWQGISACDSRNNPHEIVDLLWWFEVKTKFKQITFLCISNNNRCTRYSHKQFPPCPGTIASNLHCSKSEQCINRTKIDHLLQNASRKIKWLMLSFRLSSALLTGKRRLRSLAIFERASRSNFPCEVAVSIACNHRLANMYLKVIHWHLQNLQSVHSI